MRLAEWFGLAVMVGMVCGVRGSDSDNSEITADVNDLLEMIPWDELAGLFFEYMSSDTEVRNVMQYLLGPTFKSNLVQFETSAAFHETYDSLLPLGVDIYSMTNEVNRLLDIATIRPVRRRRRMVGEGVYGLVKDALALLPLQDIKESYNSKLDTNPEFERLMDNLLTSEMRSHIYTLMGTPEFEQTSTDLSERGVAVNEIIDLIENKIVDFFDLDKDEGEDEEDDDDE